MTSFGTTSNSKWPPQTPSLDELAKLAATICPPLRVHTIAMGDGRVLRLTEVPDLPPGIIEVRDPRDGALLFEVINLGRPQFPTPEWL